MKNDFVEYDSKLKKIVSKISANDSNPLFLHQIHSLKLKQMAYVITEDCIACGTCIDECPVEAISEGDIYKIDAEICTDCGTCADACPTEAIHPM